MLKNKLLLTLISASFIQFFAFIPNSYALKTDRDQPADISSDEVDVDFKTGRRTFIGNVRFVQGTLRVKGDRVDATFKDGKLVKAIAYGKPAAFKQRPDDKPNDVEGRGLTIVLDQRSNLLTLNKRASLKQGTDVARGSVIIYNMADDTLKVKGNATGSTGKKKQSQAKPKTQTDPFFNEKPTEPLKSSNSAAPPVTTEKTEKTTTNTSEETTETTETKTEANVPAASTQRRSDELPEELVLPGQSSSKSTTRESSGRSRLIFKPKSK